MSDLQLERSVLEAKERDELFAIALALGSKPSARTKKADLVSQILQVTGVDEVAAPAEKPRRSRTARAAATVDKAPAEGAEQLELATTNGNGRVGHDGPADGTDQRDETLVTSSTTDFVAAAPTANGDQAGTTTEGTAGAPTGDNNQAVAPAQSFQRADHGRPRTDRADRQEQRPERQDQRPERTERPDQRGDADPGLGNSRRRRRRNREKATRGGVGVAPEREREFTAQAPEAPYSGELVPCTGLLDLRDEGYGFLRTNGYLASSSDVYVSITQVRRYGLRKGDSVEGAFRPAANNEKYPALVKVDLVAGGPPDEARNRPKFENLTPLFPDEPGQRHRPHSGSCLADRQGPTRDDRVAAQGGQDHHLEADRPLHRSQ
jgi:transcription termination factor Rho